jgi:hypothetical protein
MGSDFEARILEINKTQQTYFIAALAAKQAGDEAGYEKAMAPLPGLEAEAMGLLKAEGARLTALLRLKRAASDDDKVAQLLEAFALAAKLTRIWDDVYEEQKKSVACQFKGSAAGRRLDEIGEGRRGDLAVFLDGKDPGAKAMAANLLFKMMPERCLSLLEELSQSERWYSAGRIAVAGLCVHRPLEEPVG